IAVLKGSFVFAADLLRAMYKAGLAPQVEFVHLSSYRAGTTSSGTVTILRDIESDVRGRDVLLVDDILESGRTLAFAKDLLVARDFPRTTILLMTGFADQRERASDLEAIIHDVVTKPFSLAEIRQKASEAISAGRSAVAA